MSQPRFDDGLRASITQNLKQLKGEDASHPSLKPAAVCVIVTDDGAGGASLVLTLRSRNLKTHAGQYALPGGRMDARESAIEAGLREAREEIGLHLDASAVLGCLDDFPTRSGYLITPLVAWAPAGMSMQANPDEVAAIYRIGFDQLNQPGVPEFVSIPESDRPVIRYPLLGTRIHAPTAAVIYQFMEVAVHGRATRVAHLEQPVWAWR